MVTGGVYNKAFIVSYSNLFDNHSKGNFNKIILSEGDFKNTFVINGHKGNLNELHLLCSQSLTGTIEFKKLDIKAIKISGDNHKGSIIFNECAFGNTEFNNFFNYNNFAITSCQAINNYRDSKLIIKNSNLGKAQLFSVKLNTFNQINIQDSFMSEIITSGVNWFKDVDLNKESRTDSSKMREIYRQLKNAQEKQGNNIQALEFKALELTHFKNEFSNNSRWNINKLILWTSQSNDFGLNWWKPVKLLFGFTLVFYALIVEAIYFEEHIYSSDTNIGILLKPLWDNIKFFPELFNPTRVLSRSFNEGNIGFFVNTMDIFHRIILAFFIFQIVSAFRKYIK